MKAKAMKLSQLIAEVVQLNNAVMEFEHAEIQKLYPGAHAVPISVYDRIPPAPARQQLHDLVRAQSPATIYMLIVLWRLGRGDFRARSNLRKRYLEVGDSFPSVRAATGYLLGKKLPRYLGEALRQLARAGIDVDQLLA
jgi:hypothetical protein